MIDGTKPKARVNLLEVTKLKDGENKLWRERGERESEMVLR